VSPAALPEAARRISGRSWTLEQNGLGIRSISLSFGDRATATGTFEARGWTQTFAIGLDGVWRLSPGGRFGLPVASRGAWIGPTQFTFDLDETANTNHWWVASSWGTSRSCSRFMSGPGCWAARRLRLRGVPAR